MVEPAELDNLLALHAYFGENSRMPQSVMYWFGPAPWGPALDPDDAEFRAVKIPTPVGQKCLWCEERIKEGDSGEMTVANSAPILGIVAVAEIVPQHRECALLHIAGHDFGLCSCTDYEGLSQRQAALECDRRIQAASRPASD